MNLSLGTSLLRLFGLLVASALALGGLAGLNTSDAYATTTSAETCGSSTTGLTFNGGDGSSGSPFLISSAGNLETLKDCVNNGNSTYNSQTVYYQQTADIDWSNGGNDTDPIGDDYSDSFRANYDGNGKAIHNFSSEYGLFAYGAGCTIENLTASGEVAFDSPSSQRDLGVLMGRSDGCSFDNVTVYGSANLDTNSNSSVGGLLGYEDDALTVTNSSIHVDVTIDGGAYYAGGVVGRVNGSGDMTTVTVSPKDDPHTTSTTQERGSINVGTVAMKAVGGAVGLSKSVDFASVNTSIPITTSFTSASAGYDIGGLIGDTVQGASVTDSTASGAISVEFFRGTLGGLIGDSEVSVSNSSSTSTISIKLGHVGADVGGLVGSASGAISQSYYSGTIGVLDGSTDVTTEAIAGLVGTLVSSVSESYANVTFTGSAQNPAGLVGVFHGSATEITDSFAFGSISGEYPSGLVGEMQGGDAAKVTNSYTFATLSPTNTEKWHPVVRDRAVSNSVYWNRTQTGPAPGSLTKPSYSPGAVELSDAEFVDTAEFSGWDFSSTWTMGTCAPYLTWIGSSPSGLCPATVPSAPTIDTVTAGDSQLAVAFTAGSDGGAAISDYEYSTDSGSNWTSVGQTTSPFTITGLTNGQSYSVTLRAWNSEGESTNSNAVSGTPVAPTPSPTPSSDPDSDDTTPAATPTPLPTTPALPPRPASPPDTDEPERETGSAVPATPPGPSGPAEPDTAPAAPASPGPAPGPGTTVLSADEVMSGQIVVPSGTENVAMPAVLLRDIATELAPAGAPMDDGVLLIETGQTMVPVLMVSLGDVTLRAADLGTVIHFTLNIPGFESNSMSVAVERQVVTWMLWVQVVLLIITALAALALLLWFIGTRRRGQRDKPSVTRVPSNGFARPQTILQGGLQPST